MSEAYEHAIRNELAYWPGVAVEFGKRSKHRQAVLHYRGETRFVVYPDSPSDGARGHLNCLSNVRQELATLGAHRLEKRPKKRKRGPRVIGHQTPNRPDWASRIERAPVKPNPFDALADFVPVAQWTEHGDSTSTVAGSTPARHTIFRRIWNRIRAIAAAAREGGDVEQAPGNAPQSGGAAASPDLHGGIA